MKRKYVATIDCGTSSVRCLLFDVDTGEQAAVRRIDWYPSKDKRIPGAFDFDGAANWPLVCDCVRGALASVDAGAVAAVTASGFRHGFLCVDAEGREVFGCYNMDFRAESQVKRLVREGLAPRIYAINGDWPNVQALPRLMWIRDERPEDYASIDTLLLVSDWVVRKLSGVAAMEPGNASSTNLFDIRERKWSSEIADMCGLRGDIFPRIADAGTVVGEVTGEAAESTGLRKGTPVVVGVADTQGGLVGVGSIGRGAAAIVGGSWWLDCLNVDRPFIDANMRLRTSCHSERGMWAMEGVGCLVGLAMRWFRDAFGSEEKAIERTYGIDSYSLLERLARDVPAGSHGVQVLLSDLVNMKDWKHAAPTFTGWDILSPEKAHKGVFFKAMMENAAMQARGEFLNIAEVAGEYPKRIVLSGGAAKSGMWGQIIADVARTEVVVPREKEGTALGAAIYAAVGIGAYTDTGEATGSLVRIERKYEPSAENFPVYERLFRQWRALYREGLDLVDRGIVASMWQAAGTASEAQMDSDLLPGSHGSARVEPGAM